MGLSYSSKNGAVMLGNTPLEQKTSGGEKTTLGQNTSLGHSILVENLKAVEDCPEPRWRGEVLFPGQAQKVPILLIYFQNRWNVSELHCPHEMALLDTATLTQDGYLQCPRHHNRYPLNSCFGYAVDVYPVAELSANQLPAEAWPEEKESSVMPKPPRGGFFIRCFDYGQLAGEYWNLKDEIKALRAANHLRENQIIDNMTQMDSMLKEVEQSKTALQSNYEQSESMAILFSRLMDSVSEILLVLDKQGVIQRCNQPALLHFGCEKKALLGINPDTLLCDDSQAILTDTVNPRPMGTKSLIYEGVNQNPHFEIEVCFAIDRERTEIKPGQQQQAPSVFLIHGSMLYSRNGMEEGCVLVASDISQVKRREKDLRERQLIDKARLLQVTMDNVSHGMAVFDQQEQLQVWNHAFFEVLEYPPSLKTKGLPFNDLQHFDQLRGEKLFASKGNSLLTIQTSLRLEYQMRNGRSIEYVLNQLPDQGRVISVQDVTEQKKAEATIRQINESLERRVAERTLEIKKAYVALEGSLKELQNTQEQLVQSEKLASLGQLVAGIAHEMNTPVGVCLTTVTFLAENTQEIKKDYREDALTIRKFDDYLESCQSSLDFTVKNLERAAKLVNSFKQLAMDRYKEKIQEFILYQHVQNILTTLDPHVMICRPRIELSGTNTLKISSYPNVWEQIVTSLIMNSLRHAFTDMPFGQGLIHIQIQQKDNNLQFSFRDNGCGMDKNQCEKIFDPFYTTSRGRGDVGLGMHIVFNMVNQILKGSISCQSSPGEGTRFSIRTPL